MGHDGVRTKKMKGHSLLLVIILALFVIITTSQVNKPAVTDEYVYFQGMSMLAHNNTLFESVGEGRSTDDFIAAYAHMPFYIWSGSLFLKLFGAQTSVARLVTVLSSLISLILVWRILHMLNPDRYKQVILTTLLAVHPLFVQNSILIDIDGSVLSLFLLLTMYWYLKGRTLIMTVSLSLAFFSKLTTGFLVIGIIIIYELLKKNKRALVTYPIVLAFSLFISFLLNLLFAWRYSMEWTHPYEQFISAVLVPGLTDHPSLLSKVILVGMNSIELATWFNIMFLLLISYAVYQRARCCIQRKNVEVSDLFLFGGTLIFLFYALLFPPTFGFPKYYQTAIVLMLIGLSGLDMRKFDFRRNWLAISTLVVFTTLFLQDRVLHQVIYLASPITEFVKQQLAVLTSFLIGYLLLKGRSLRDAAVPLLITLFIVIDIFIVLGPNVGYFYGERGMQETVNYIRQNTDEKEIIISPLDVAHQSGRRYYGFEGYDNDLRIEIFHEDFEREDTSKVVLRKKYYRYHPELKTFLDNRTTLVRDFGDFQIRRQNEDALNQRD